MESYDKLMNKPTDRQSWAGCDFEIIEHDFPDIIAVNQQPGSTMITNLQIGDMIKFIPLFDFNYRPQFGSDASDFEVDGSRFR